MEAALVVCTKRLWGLSLLVATGCMPGIAMAQDYRQLSFDDGRVWTVDLVQTDTEGMLVEIPQGRAWVSYETVTSIVSVDTSAIEARRPWQVKLLPIETGGVEPLLGPAREISAALFGQLEAWEGISVRRVRTRVDRGVTVDADEDCGLPSAISLENEEKRGTDYILAGHVREAEGGGVTLTLCSVYTRGMRRLVWLDVNLQMGDIAVDDALSAVFGLLLDKPVTDTSSEPADDRPSSPVAEESSAEEDPPPEQTPAFKPEDRLETQDSAGGQEPDLRRLAFVPLPGFPSLYVRDLPRFGGAWAAIVPLSTLATLWINTSVAFRPAQRVFLTTAAYYAITVGVNQYMAQESGVFPAEEPPGLP
jgi:hypothetical protein